MATENLGKTVSVLIVEDNADAADSLARFLRLGYGYDVTIASDGLAGIRAALDCLPDVVVCDIGLPKRNGLLLAEDLVEQLPRRPLMIAVTGYSHQVKPEHAAAAGFDHFLVKPADPFAIEAIIENHVRDGSGTGGRA